MTYSLEQNCPPRPSAGAAEQPVHTAATGAQRREGRGQRPLRRLWRRAWRAGWGAAGGSAAVRERLREWTGGDSGLPGAEVDFVRRNAAPKLCERGRGLGVRP